MYTDIEKKLNKITDSLKEELLKAKAIDENGRAIDVKKFNQIINSLKQEGRESEIQNSLINFKKNNQSEINSRQKDLCWLYGDVLGDYLHDIEICLEFEKKNILPMN